MFSTSANVLFDSEEKAEGYSISTLIFHSYKTFMCYKCPLDVAKVDQHHLWGSCEVDCLFFILCLTKARHNFLHPVKKFTGWFNQIYLFTFLFAMREGYSWGSMPKEIFHFFLVALFFLLGRGWAIKRDREAGRQREEESYHSITVTCEAPSHPPLCGDIGLEPRQRTEKRTRQ